MVARLLSGSLTGKRLLQLSVQGQRLHIVIEPSLYRLDDGIERVLGCQGKPIPDLEAWFSLAAPRYQRTGEVGNVRKQAGCRPSPGKRGGRHRCFSRSRRPGAAPTTAVGASFQPHEGNAVSGPRRAPAHRPGVLWTGVNWMGSSAGTAGRRVVGVGTAGSGSAARGPLTFGTAGSGSAARGPLARRIGVRRAGSAGPWNRRIGVRQIGVRRVGVRRPGAPDAGSPTRSAGCRSADPGRRMRVRRLRNCWRCPCWGCPGGAALAAPHWPPERLAPSSPGGFYSSASSCR
jgi:hypothetical protein